MEDLTPRLELGTHTSDHLGTPGRCVQEGNEKQYPESHQSGCSFSISATVYGLGSLEGEGWFPLPCSYTLVFQKLLEQRLKGNL